jgi:hypothetical protein
MIPSIVRIPEFDQVIELNSTLGKQKMPAMATDVVAGFKVVDGFEEKVDAYLKKHIGTRGALLLAMEARAPAIRLHVLEGCRITLNETDYAKWKKEYNSSVFHINPKAGEFELFVPQKMNKVKNLGNFYSNYTGNLFKNNSLLI